MATTLHIEQDYTCSARALFELVSSEAFDIQLLQAQNMGREVVLREERDDQIELRLRMTPPTKLPGFMRKLAGGRNSYVEHRVWHPEKLMNTWRIEPGLSSGKIDIEGTVHLIDDAETGGCKRIIDGSFDVRLPLVGGRVEKFIIKQTTEGFQNGARWIANYIREHGIT